MELNDKQLEAVAGGYFYSVTLYLLSYLANNILDL